MLWFPFNMRAVPLQNWIDLENPEVLAAAAARSLGSEEAWVVHRSIRTPHTVLHQAGPLGRPVAWIKHYLKKPGEAAREHEFLRHVRPVFLDQAGLDLVEPLAVWPGRNILIIRHADGLRLADWLLGTNPCLPPVAREIEGQCIRCGQWLARLHRDADPPRPGILEDTVASVVEMVRQFRPIWKLPVRMEDRVRRFAERCVEMARPEDMRLVATHGDFGPHNILVEPSRTTVIDPSFPPDLPRHEHRALCFEDLLRFYVCVRGYETGHAWSFRRRRWAESFLRSYGESRGWEMERRRGLFPLFWMKYQLYAWRDWAPPASSFAGHWAGWRFRLWLAAVAQ
jgi:hypothetical protein